MAGFCTKCGSRGRRRRSVLLTVRYARCAATRSSTGTCAAAPAGVQAAGAAPGAAPAKSGSAAVKIIVGLLAFFALVTLLGIGSCVYFGYRVRKRARELSRTVSFETTQSATSGQAACRARCVFAGYERRGGGSAGNNRLQGQRRDIELPIYVISG